MPVKHQRRKPLTESLLTIREQVLAEPVRHIFLASLLLLLIIIPFDSGGNGYILQFITRLLMLLCALVWALQTIRRGTMQILVNGIDVVVIAGVLWVLVSLITTRYVYATLLEIIKILTYIALFYLFRIAFPLKTVHKTLLLATMLGSSLVQLVLALFSEFLSDSSGFIVGFANPNHLACFWGLGTTIALSVLIFSRKTQENDASRFLRLGGKTVLSLLIGILMVAILLLKSRGALAGVAGAGFFICTLKKPRWGGVFLTVLALVLILPTPWGSPIQRLMKTDDPYAYQRIGIWQSSVRMLRDFPVFGVGPGMYRYYGQRYSFPLEHQVARYAKAPNMAHNDFLRVGAELGVIGMLLMMGGAAMVASLAVKILKRRPVSWHGVAAFGGLLGLGIQSMVSDLLVSPAIAVCGVVLVALLVEENWTLHQTPPLRKVCTRKWLWYTLLLVIFAAIFVFALYIPTIAHIHYLQFYQSFENGDYTAAVHHLTTAIQYVPIHAYYHHDLGTLYATAFENRPDMSIFQAGRREFMTAIRLNPKNYEHHLALADFHEAVYRYNPTVTNAHYALQEYRRALVHSPFDPFIRYSMAALHAQIREYQEAIDVLNEAIAMEPNFVGGYQLLGDILLAMQRPQEARQAYEQAEAIMRQIPVQALNSEYARELVRSNNEPHGEDVD